MKIVKYIVGPRNSYLHIVDLNLLYQNNEYYFFGNNHEIYKVSKNLNKETESNSEKNPQDNKESSKEFQEAYNSVMSCLKYQTNLINTALDDIRCCESRIADYKSQIAKANENSIACMKKLSELTHLMHKECTHDGESDNR